jgi:hypothetical protein
MHKALKMLISFRHAQANPAAVPRPQALAQDWIVLIPGRITV